jgi:hypothetical protein
VLILLVSLAIGGCMGMPPEGGGGAGGTGGGTGGNGGADMAGNEDALPPTGRTLFEACSDNAQCASMLCTKDSYDRLTNPICTEKCDPAAPSSPQCPNGCNMKGYCRLPK